MSLRPPGGTPPPATAEIDGHRVDLAAVAADIVGRYAEHYPDELQRYGEAGLQWARHDNRWLLSWAVDDVLGAVDLGAQVAWLARVLRARDFPLSRLAHNLQIAAGVVAEGAFGAASPAVAARLLAAVEAVVELEAGELAPRGDSPA